jgi:acyl carrier protein
MTSQKDIEELIRNTFYELLKISKNTPIDDIPINDLNIDSLEFFEFIVDLEETHKIFIPIENIGDEITLSSLISSAQIN